MKKYFKRGNQYWCIDGKDILLINLKEKGHHYDGDAHIFLNGRQFNQVGGIEITEREFKKVRETHVKRIRKF